MDRSQKEALVSDVRVSFSDSSLVLLIEQSGLTVSEMTDLRKGLKQKEASLKIVKNTLAKLAVKDTDLEALSEHFKGTTAVAYSKDPVGPAKAIVDFSNDNDKVKVIAGALDGKILSAADVNALSKMPSLDELRGTLVGLLNAPATKIARISKESASMVARVIAAKGQQ